jgi:hypothetical protein
MMLICRAGSAAAWDEGRRYGELTKQEKRLAFDAPTRVAASGGSEANPAQGQRWSPTLCEQGSKSRRTTSNVAQLNSMVYTLCHSAILGQAIGLGVRPWSANPGKAPSADFRTVPST